MQLNTLKDITDFEIEIIQQKLPHIKCKQNKILDIRVAFETFYRSIGINAITFLRVIKLYIKLS